MKHKTELHTLQCGTCGVWHAIPKAMHDTCLEEGGFWHCPNGCRRGFTEGRRKREAVRQERDRLKQQQARYEDELRQAREGREAAERRLSASKGQITRLRKRASSGVCPCCTRHFTQLERHMASKHPEFLAEETE